MLQKIGCIHAPFHLWCMNAPYNCYWAFGTPSKNSTIPVSNEYSAPTTSKPSELDRVVRFIEKARLLNGLAGDGNQAVFVADASAQHHDAPLFCPADELER